MYRVENILSAAAGLLTALTLLSASASANLIVNSDFEAGNTGFSSDYTNSTYIFGASTYAITTNPNINHGGGASYGDNTSGSGLMMAVNGSDTAGDVIWSQTVSVSTATAYQFAVYISSWSDVNPADLQFTVNGTSIGGLQAPSETGVWKLAFANWYSFAATSATIEFTNLNTLGSGNDFALDDLYFGAPIHVSEPGALAVLLVGLAGIGYARRKKVSLTV